MLTGIILLAAISLGGQVIINEFCASNSSLAEDPLFGEYADWLELHNTGATSVNLNGHYITDNFDNPVKWRIEVDTVLPPDAYMLIWVDDRDTLLHASFKISASGEELALFSPGQVLLDSVSFPVQVADVSMGRVSGNPAAWHYFSEPTPGEANTTDTYAGIVFHTPSFSLRGGMYAQPRQVEIRSDFGGELRYTLDGSQPTEDSPLFQSALDISQTTIVRARVFRPGQLPGPVITQSYFINENSVAGKLPVVSIASEAENFWDPEDGIYTHPDFKPSWEIPVNIELFENNGLDRAAFNQRAGIKINGLYSWKLPQKMLGVYFKKAYGPGNLDYRLTPQRERYSYKNFALRASGSDWSYTLFRDVLAQHSTLYNMDLDIMGFRPAVVFVNGEYLGIHNIREKVDADYIEKSYHLEPGSFDLVENQEFPEAGDMEAYDRLRTLLDQDLSVEANYKAVQELVDVENFTDMVITEMACRNTSIDHNIMSWKPKEGGKWRWVLMDLDRGFFEAPNRKIDFYLGERQLILRDLFENDGYRDYFARRLALQLFTTYNPVRMEALIDEHEASIEAELPRHIQRWEGTTSSYGDALQSFTYWKNQVNNLRSFVRDRPFFLLANLVNYDYPESSTLVLSCWPEEAGEISMNGMRTAGPFSYGPMIRDKEFTLQAKDRPGYRFEGWYSVPAERIIPKASEWKYLDKGQDPGPDWMTPDFDDSAWSSGLAQLGYGDGDENTEIGFGGNESDRHITYWFRKGFSATASQQNQGTFFVHLLMDDGAIVYLNGIEIVRSNLPHGEVSSETLTPTHLGGEAEEIYLTYKVDPELLREGENLLAVEIHQNTRYSTDLSFDLGLTCYHPEDGELRATNPATRIRLGEEDLWYMARYESNGACLVPPVITGDQVLSIDCSPYQVQEHVSIPEGSSLTIEAGVEIRMPEDGCFFVNGILKAEGSPEEPILLRKDPSGPGGAWGGLVFRNTPEASVLSHLTIEGASEGPDPLLENAAISAFRADLLLEHLTLVENHSNPIMARYSDITLRNSTLHSEVTGDLINVKYGDALIEGCRFTGNDMPDTDAIDLDETGRGVIRGCTISGFYGFNSDAVDIGEGALGVVIDSIVAWNITDKGVSLGQRSSATLNNNIFYNCHMGVAVKDSSSALVRNCVFYSTGYPVACFEKNPGQAGGNAHVLNSILSNSYEAPILADGHSSLSISHSLSDNGPLPEGTANLEGNPLFRSPSIFDFSLQSSSPALMAGSGPSGPVDLGTTASPDSFPAPPMFAQIYVNGSGWDRPQYLMLYNPSDEVVDLEGYAIDKGVTATFPAGSFIRPKGRFFITDRPSHSLWEASPAPVISWSDGRLSGNGESLRLVGSHGIVMDYLVYSDESWPAQGFGGDQVFTLLDPGLDNHLAEHWATAELQDVIVGDMLPPESSWQVYPNPARDRIHILLDGYGADRQAKDWQTANGHCDPAEARLYTLDGRLLETFRLQPGGRSTLDISPYGKGIYILKAGPLTNKIVILD